MRIRPMRMRIKRVFTFLLVLILVGISYTYYTLYFKAEKDSPSRQSILHGGRPLSNDDTLKENLVHVKQSLQHESKEEPKVMHLFPHGIQKHIIEKQELDDEMVKELDSEEEDEGNELGDEEDEETNEEEEEDEEDEEDNGDLGAEEEESREEDSFAIRMAKQQQIIEKQKELLRIMKDEVEDNFQKAAMLPDNYQRHQPQVDGKQAPRVNPAEIRQQLARKPWEDDQRPDARINPMNRENQEDTRVFPLHPDGIQAKKSSKIRQEMLARRQAAPEEQFAEPNALRMFNDAHEEGKEWLQNSGLQPAVAKRPVGNVPLPRGARINAENNQGFDRRGFDNFQDDGRLVNDFVQGNNPQAGGQQGQAGYWVHAGGKKGPGGPLARQLGLNEEQPFNQQGQINPPLRPQGNRVDGRAMVGDSVRNNPQFRQQGNVDNQAMFQDYKRNNPVQFDRFRNQQPPGDVPLAAQDRNPFFANNVRNGNLQRPVKGEEHNVGRRSLTAVELASMGRYYDDQVKDSFMLRKPYEDEDPLNSDQKMQQALQDDFNRIGDKTGNLGSKSNIQAHPENDLFPKRFKPVQKDPVNNLQGNQEQNAQQAFNKPVDFQEMINREDSFPLQVKNLQEPVGEKISCIDFWLLFKKLCVYPSTVDTKTSRELLLRGKYHEQEELMEFMAALGTSKDLAAVDIGAGLGIYSLAAAGLGRTVLSVEPMRDHQLHFIKTMQINNLTEQVTLITNALGQQKGYGRLRSPHPSGNMGAVYVDVISDLAQAGSDVTNIVRIVRLDDALPVMTFSKAVVKLDVQGDEELVLRGAHEFFDTIDVPYVLMHWLPTFDRKHLEECQDFLTHRGYIPTPAVHSTTAYSDADLRGDINFIVWRKQKENEK